MFTSERTAEIFSRLGEPVFLARQTEHDGACVVTLHTMERRTASRVAVRAREALQRAGADAQCRVVAHNPRALRRVRSLEALTRRFGQGRVIYDPTGFIGRSEAVADCARRLRASLGGRVQNIFLDTSRRTLYVIVKETATGTDAIKERGEVVSRAGAIMLEWQKSVDAQFSLAVRIGVEPPRGVRLVSVDAQSVARTISAQLQPRKGLVRGAIALSTAVLFGATMTVPAAAASGPAVAKTNGSVVVRGGAYDLNGVDSNGEGELLGRVNFPIGQSFGGQVEGAVGTQDYWGIGGQLFWRDPSWVSVGVFGSFDDSDGVELTRYGAAADFYLNNFTLGGRIGGQDGDVGDGLFGRVDVIYYIDQNLLVHGGVEFEPDDAPNRDLVGRVGFEWQPAMDSSPGLSVFADGEWGDDYDHVRAGLRIHLGADGVDMMSRHRQYNHGDVTSGRRGYGESSGYGGYEVPVG